MKRGTIAYLILIGLSLTLMPTTNAQADSDGPVGISGAVSFPFGEFGDKAKTGYGLHAMGDYILHPLFHLSGNVGFHHFKGEADQDDLTVWEFSVGARFVLGAFYMGGESGYFTEVDEGSFIPNLGLRFGNWEGAMRWKAVGGGSWKTLRIGYYF